MPWLISLLSFLRALWILTFVPLLSIESRGNVLDPKTMQFISFLIEPESDARVLALISAEARFAHRSLHAAQFDIYSWTATLHAGTELIELITAYHYFMNCRPPRADDRAILILRMRSHRFHRSDGGRMIIITFYPKVDVGQTLTEPPNQFSSRSVPILVSLTRRWLIWMVFSMTFLNGLPQRLQYRYAHVYIVADMTEIQNSLPTLRNLLFLLGKFELQYDWFSLVNLPSTSSQRAQNLWQVRSSSTLQQRLKSDLTLEFSSTGVK
jgi:hypothetical protein